MPIYESIAGIQSQALKGSDWSTTVTAAQIIMPANPRRKWAIIEAGPELTMDVSVYLGNATTPIVLTAGGSILIDKDTPFTGSISAGAYNGVTSVLVRAFESEVE